MEITAIHHSDLPDVAQGSSIFGSRQWASAYGQGFRSFRISDKGRTIGSFCLYKGGRLGISYLITPPWAPHIGLEYDIHSEKKVGRHGESKSIHKCIAEFLSQASERVVDITLATDEQDSQPYTWTGLDVRPRHTYHLDLMQDTEVLFDALSPSRRKNIRKAEKDGLKVDSCKDVDVFMGLIDLTIQRQGLTLDRKILRGILNSPELQDYRDMYVCSGSSGILAASLVVHDRQRAYYLIGGHVGDGGHEGAGTLCLWKAMLDAKDRGQRIFDLEGSMIPSVERYYRGFGGEMMTFFQVRTADALGRLALKWKER